MHASTQSSNKRVALLREATHSKAPAWILSLEGISVDDAEWMPVIDFLVGFRSADGEEYFDHIEDISGASTPRNILLVVRGSRDFPVQEMHDAGFGWTIQRS